MADAKKHRHTGIRGELIKLLGQLPCYGPDPQLGGCPFRRHGVCREVEKLDYCAVQALADHLIANGDTFAKDNNVPSKWIPVTERLPEPETEVVILAERKYYSFIEKRVTTHHIVTTGMYEDGSKNTENSDWVWETDGFEYDEELDAYIIPEGWWEWKHYIDDECRNYAIDDVVTHWMPLPEPPKGE